MQYNNLKHKANILTSLISDLNSIEQTREILDLRICRMSFTKIVALFNIYK